MRARLVEERRTVWPSCAVAYRISPNAPSRFASFGTAAGDDLSAHGVPDAFAFFTGESQSGMGR